MRTLELPRLHTTTIVQLLDWARQENVLIRDQDGEEFLVTATSDFNAEVSSLGQNDEFIAFLDARAREPKISLSEARKRLLALD